METGKPAGTLLSYLSFAFGFFSFFGSAGKHPCWIIHSVSVAGQNLGVRHR